MRQLNVQEFKNEFQSDLENGLDHAEWYKDEMKWLIEQAEEVESLQQKLDAKITLINNGWEEERYVLQEENENLKRTLQLILSKSVIPFDERKNIDPYDVIMDIGTVAEGALQRI